MVVLFLARRVLWAEVLGIIIKIEIGHDKEDKEGFELVVVSNRRY